MTHRPPPRTGDETNGNGRSSWLKLLVLPLALTCIFGIATWWTSSIVTLGQASADHGARIATVESQITELKHDDAELLQMHREILAKLDEVRAWVLKQQGKDEAQGQAEYRLRKDFPP